MHQHLIVLLALEVADFATPLCDPLRVEPPRSERPNITLTYDSTPDETNKYQNGTNVTFNCPPHYPIGVDKYGVCIDGEWKTLLVYGWDKTIPGFCQRQCDAEKLRKEKGFALYPKTGEQSKYLKKGNSYQWVEHGTTISALCERTLLANWYLWTCDDGYWKPVHPFYDRCSWW